MTFLHIYYFVYMTLHIYFIEKNAYTFFLYMRLMIMTESDTMQHL